MDFDDLLLKVLELLGSEQKLELRRQHFFYLLVDEFQDISPVQYRLIKAWNKGGKELFLIGDPDQSIYGFRGSQSNCFDQLCSDYSQACVLRLKPNYRSTPEITQLFASLLDDDERLSISSIQRADAAPEIIACASEQDYDRELRRVLAQAVGDDGLTAVVVPQKHQAKLLRRKLGDAAPALIDAAATLPASGVVLVPLKLAKGLEFDHVIVPDASERAFPDDPLSRRRLYTTVSRATRGITLLAQGEITPLLAARA